MKHWDGILVRLVAAALVFLCATGLTEASINRGDVQGTVTDQQGGAVVGARVVVKNLDTNVQLDLKTNSVGFYLAAELVPGKYSIYVLANGFKPLNVADVEVRPAALVTVDAQLEVGAVAQAVTVTATNPLVQTSASNFTNTVGQRLVEDLPMVGRDIEGFAALMPGAVSAVGPPGSIAGFNSAYTGFPDPTHIEGSGIAVNGGQGYANQWFLDGNLNTAQGVDNAVVNPAPEAVASMQAVTNNFAPEYGRTSGAVFSVVLKSGTNRLHGDLYEYNRNSYFAAFNPFAARTFNGGPAVPNYNNWNQFGGTIGGPVVIPHVYDGKDRTFFFVSFDDSKLAARAQYLGTVPTLLERQANFSEFPNVKQYGIYDPLTTTYNTATGTYQRQPFRNLDGTLASSLPANRLDPTTLYFLSTYPKPNFLYGPDQNAGGCLNTCDNYLSSYGSAQTTHNMTFKVDQKIDEKNRLFAEFLYNPTDYAMNRLPWSGPTAPVVGFYGNFPFRITNLVAALGLNTTFTPSLLNEFRYSYSRQADIAVPLGTSLGAQDIVQHIQGLNLPVNPPLQPTPIFAIGGLSSFGNTGSNADQVTQGHTIIDNLTKIISAHTIKIGVLYRLDQTGNKLPIYDDLSFGGGLTQNSVTGQGGSGLAQFLLGAVDQNSNVRWVFPTFSSTKEWAAYIQDDFRVTSKLSLNYGLRWDRWGWPADRFGNASYFNFTQPNSVIPGLKGQIIYVKPGETMLPGHNADFAPRFNFAYTLTPKTVIRGGWDMIYNDDLSASFGQSTGPAQGPGFNAYSYWTNYDATGQGLTNTSMVPAFILSQGAPPLQPFMRPQPSNVQVNIGSPGAGILTQIPTTHDPYNEVWNFTVQQQLPGDMVLTVSYVGNEGHFLSGENNRLYNYVSTANTLQYRDQLNFRVPTPALYQLEWGPQVAQSQLLKPYPQYNYVDNFLTHDLNSNYQGLQVNVSKRYSHGLSLNSSYAWQKSIVSPGLSPLYAATLTGGSFGPRGGLAVETPGLVGFGYTSAQDKDNRNGDRTVSPFDATNVFNLSWTYELPTASFVRGKGRVADAFWGGWKFAGTFTASGGLPMHITGPSNPLTNRVNLIGDPSARRGSKTRYQLEQQWYNPNAFEAVFGSDPQIIQLKTSGTPAQQAQHNEFYRFGTAGYLLGNARAPGFWGTDMSLFKQFKITESSHLQLRFTAFNALNHQNLALPGTGWCLPPNPDGSTDAVHKFGCSFGKITNIQTDPRSLQFGLNLQF